MLENRKQIEILQNTKADLTVKEQIEDNYQKIS